MCPPLPLPPPAPRGVRPTPQQPRRDDCSYWNTRQLSRSELKKKKGKFDAGSTLCQRELGLFDVETMLISP